MTTGDLLKQGTHVPVVDLGRSSSSVDRSALARTIDAAYVETGFLMVVGHGVDRALVAEMVEVTNAFFAQPTEVKAGAAASPDDQGMRGWHSFGGYVSASMGVETQPDLCEMFGMSRLGEPGIAERSGLGEAVERLGHPNPWPDRPSAFRDVWLRYYAAMESLASYLVELFALAHSLPEGWFADKIDHPTTSLLGNWYYPQSARPAPGQHRKGPHTDFGMLTILLRDAVGGLQVSDRDGAWHDVPFVEDSFVVNIGDLMAAWTNDRWVSTLHRVVNPTGDAATAPRTSIAFFQEPNYDAVVECLPTCTAPDDPPRHEPVVAGEWIARKVTASYLSTP
jgi:isopenicillin N synthase-like dioxygenase